MAHSDCKNGTIMNTQKRTRKILVHGLILVMVGLVWGFFVPHTPYPRLALGAHIQLITNGILFIIMAVLLTTLPHRVGAKSLGVMLLAVWLTWAMGMSEVGNAWWGATQMLPIAGDQAGAKGGLAWHELFIKLTHIAAGLGLVAAWILLILGFLKCPDAAGSSQ